MTPDERAKTIKQMGHHLARITATDDQLKAALVELGRAEPMFMCDLHLAAAHRNPAEIRALDDTQLVAFAAAACIGIGEVARSIQSQEETHGAD